MTTAEVERYMRASAARGLSRTAVFQALGIRYARFMRILSTLQDVQWVGPGRSVDQRRYYESIKGHCPDHLRAVRDKAGAATRAMYSHTVRDSHGTIAQLIEHFGLSVTASTVRKRMAKGADLETALFTPAGQFRSPKTTPQE